ncbi:ATP-binding cassette domain-containing protein [Weissella ceti]|uniref:ATP-binding cassette domain-containing protein n=1 Tax=Weissella ceti TaxID=759620 RepID=A0ABT3E4R9_9LACO|nr:ATP-binding cassette domain-containing protein [Weissella ceti]MCW0953416.1 ATP-binding cassette domain-containing protein [Weissella ceti]QVK12019.1 ATP-binding cassette domain-containing protein [Weissella ceti]
MVVVKGAGVGIAFGDRWLYREVDFELRKKRVLAVVGDNGTGKTTLIRALLGQQQITAGELIWETSDNVVRYVPQERPDAQNFPLQIADFVALSNDQGWRPWMTQAEKAHLAHILEDTNLTKLAKQRIDLASGGERQRAYLAQALLADPDVLILDEATANLDNVAKFELMDVVRHYRDHHDLSIVMISHDLDIIQKYADDYLLLRPDSSEFGSVAELDIHKLEMGKNNHV